MANKNISISSSTKDLSLPSVLYGVGDVMSLRPTEAGIYSFEIFGSSGQGTTASEVALSSGAGSGGGGGCYGYFKLKLGIFEQVGITARNFIDISFSQNEDATWEDIVLDGISVLDTGSCNFKLTAFAGKNGNVRTGGYLSFANSGGDPDNNNNILFVSYHSSSGGDGARLSDFDVNNWQNTSLGGSGGKDSSGADKGYQGGAGEVVVFGATAREAGAGQQGKIIINYIGPIETETGGGDNTGDGDNTGGGTTEPGTPSQPSTTIPDILTATSIKELKERVNQELTRRCYYGNISSEAPEYNTPNSNVVAQAKEINENVINKLILIDNKLIQENINNPIRYSYINNQLTTFEGNSNSNTGCREACTGFCSTACANMCTGCGETAKGGTASSSGSSGSSNPGSQGSTAAGCTGCGTNCVSGCVGGRNETEKETCGTTCGGSCYAVCEFSCKSSCTDTCSGGCSSGCEGCQGCSGCGSRCAGRFSGNCDTKCTGCSAYCQGTCKHDCAISCTTFCSTTSK